MNDHSSQVDFDQVSDPADVPEDDLYSADPADHPPASSDRPFLPGDDDLDWLNDPSLDHGDAFDDAALSSSDNPFPPGSDVIWGEEISISTDGGSRSSFFHPWDTNRDGKLELHEITAGLTKKWNDLDPKLKGSLSPLLLLGGSTLMTVKAPNMAVRLGGGALMGIGMNLLAAIHAGDKYTNMLEELPVKNVDTVCGVLGLASCGLLGGNAIRNMIQNRKVDANILLAFANLGPWLVTNGLSYLRGQHPEKLDEIIEKQKTIFDQPTCNIVENFSEVTADGVEVKSETNSKFTFLSRGSLPMAAESSLGMLASLCVMMFGLSKGYKDATAVGAAFTTGEFIKLAQHSPETRKIIMQGLNFTEGLIRHSAGTVANLFRFSADPKIADNPTHGR